MRWSECDIYRRLCPQSALAMFKPKSSGAGAKKQGHIFQWRLCRTIEPKAGAQRGHMRGSSRWCPPRFSLHHCSRQMPLSEPFTLRQQPLKQCRRAKPGCSKTLSLGARQEELAQLISRSRKASHLEKIRCCRTEHLRSSSSGAICRSR
jgi:hypothetical protein